MARAGWFDDETGPAFEEHLARLDHFAASMEDGIIDSDELAQQELNLMEVMRAVEPLLDDELHPKITHLMVETLAYGVMKTLHDMMAAMEAGQE